MVVDRAQLLGALPGDVDLVVAGVGLDGGGDPGALPVGEPFLPGAQDRADPAERVTAAAAVPGGGLVDPAADLIDRERAEPDDVEGVHDRGGVGEVVTDGACVVVERVQGRDLDGGAELLTALGQPVPVDLPDRPGTRSRPAARGGVRAGHG